MNARYDEIASAVPADLDALPRLRGFRLRGMQMTRLETFIDAAFAFAISMLVIAAQQIPDNIQALLFFSSRGRHTICSRDWSSDVCSSDLRAGSMVSTVALTSARSVTGRLAAP